MHNIRLASVYPTANKGPIFMTIVVNMQQDVILQYFRISNNCQIGCRHSS